ncbi:polysaccharide biosynthesis C-terminal domain-containing protein, partial [Ruminococcaceae bacterium OttesenSCG-928-I18]|nr:polysaccharide biosynthesis C-terminal domain-containing protein [Ruminococcaceae bacterium OttesenSCG-928-I18]
MEVHAEPNAKREVKHNILASDFSFTGLLRFALPTMGMMLFMGMYTIVDTIFVARFVHTFALSAINICTPVLYTIVGLTGMLATGASAIIGKKMGRGENEGARQTFSFIVLCGCALAAIFMTVGLCFLNPLLRGLGASDALMPYCRSYLSLQLWFLPANVLSVLFQNLFVTAGRPGLGLRLSLLAGVLNILLDYLFIVPLGMGIAGAALGTVLAFLPSAAGGMLFFASKRGNLYFVRPLFDLRELAQSCSNGVSEMVTQLSTAITTLCFNLTMMGLAGEAGVAAITIIIYTQFLLTTLFIGFSMGVAPVFSYNYGSESWQRMKRIFKSCVLFLAAASVLLFTAAFWGGDALAGIFVEKHSAVYAMASEGFHIFSFSFLLCGFNIFSSALFTALSNGRVSAVISFLRTLGLISAGLLLLPRVLGL